MGKSRPNKKISNQTSFSGQLSDLFGLPEKVQEDNQSTEFINNEVKFREGKMIPISEKVSKIITSQKPDNLNLLFNRYFDCWKAEYDCCNDESKKDPCKIKSIKIQEANKNDGIKEGKRDFLDYVVSRWTASKTEQFKFINVYKGRLEKQLEFFEKTNYKVTNFELTTKSRLCVGLGIDSPMETGMQLHHIYGFPYIPSTSVKGIARAYAETCETDEDKKKEIEKIFGSKSKNENTNENNQLGNVIFLDAIPASFPKLEVDIMTPHYSPYYGDQGKTAPGDWHNPTPIPFLTVAAGTKFWFGMAAKDKNKELEESQKLLDLAQGWLKGGLEHLGAGGKTAAGYGWFG